MSGDLPLLSPQRLEREGTIERIVFHNPENGYTVLKVQPEKKHACAETMVGHLATPRVGCRMRFQGQYINNPRFGRQFSFDLADEIMPATVESMRLYLASGLFRGIKLDTAGRIVEHFGLDTLRILDEEPERLVEVRGIGKKKLAQIREGWNEHRSMRNLLLFLQPHGITASCAVRIYKAYGDEALQITRENPYRLAMDIRGIGFLSADAIALKLGFTPNHPLRIQAATLYCLNKAGEEGHVYLPRMTLMERVGKLTNVETGLVDSAILELEAAQRISCEQFDEDGASGVYLKRFHYCESKTAYYIQRLLRSPLSVHFDNPQKAVETALAKIRLVLAPAQQTAVMAATQCRALVITGGPGTGKTTVINAIIKVYEGARAKILLAAPTGRAAKRMSETSSREAMTIHRLLEYSPGDDKFYRNEDSPLSCGLLIIDEASMMDTLLFYHLLKAIPPGAMLILVGDANQLPSVGPGNVLGDVISSGVVRVIELNEIFRQSAESEIICNAHLINHGKLPNLEHNPDRMSDFYFIPRDDPDEAADFIVDLIKYHIPRRFGFDAVNEIQLLTPMHKGAVGAASMNSRLQAALNPNAVEIKRGDRSFRLHDKVMQIRNNYDKDIYNGDMGRIVYLDSHERKISVDFDGVTLPYEYEELDEIIPAYAISIHKSQGSEYPAVVIPLTMQHYILLQRNLIYTGVTRGKKLVVLVGERKALEIAIANNKTSKRFTRLAQRLAASSVS